MFSIDMQNGVVQMTPPAIVAGEVAARYAGLSLSEWFYVVAILCMVVTSLASAWVSVQKAKNLKNKKEADE